MDERTELLLQQQALRDAQIKSFSAIKQFPALHSSTLDKTKRNIVLLQQQNKTQNQPTVATTKAKYRNVKSKVLEQPNKFESSLTHAPSLTQFREAVLCKHSSSQKSLTPLMNSVHQFKSQTTPRGTSYASGLGKNPTIVQPAFRPSNAGEAKTTIARKISIDPENYKTSSSKNSSPSPPKEKARIKASRQNPKQSKRWAGSSATEAKETIRIKYYQNSPSENAILADRRYTKAFIQQNLLKQQHLQDKRRAKTK